MTLSSHLTTLETSGLLRLVQAEPELEYLFRHALQQEAAYETLLRNERKRLHLIVGETLEATYPARRDELASVLAHHFEVGGDLPRALHYATLAGDFAARLYANAEAVTHYTKALELAKHSPLPSALSPTGEGPGVGALYSKLGRTLELSTRYEEAIALYADMENFARARGDQALELASFMDRAKIYSTANRLSNPALAQQMLEHARPLAHAVGDPAVETRILWNLMLLSTLQSQGAGQRIRYGEQALALARQHNLREQLAFILHDLWYAYPVGEWPKVEAALREALPLWRELDNGPMHAESTLRLSMNQGYAGRYRDSLALAAEALRLAQIANNPDSQSNTHTMVAIIQWEHGDLGAALDSLDQALALGSPLGNVTAIGGGKAFLGFFYAYLGDPQRGLALLHEAEAYAEEKIPVLAPWPRIYAARLHIRTGDLDHATDHLARLDYATVKDTLNFVGFLCAHLALAQAELAFAQKDFARARVLCAEGYADLHAIHLDFGLYDLLLLKGRAQLAMGDLDSAHATLLAAQAEAEARAAHRAQPEILRALADVATRAGDASRAKTLQAQAHALTRALAATLPPELQASFQQQLSVTSHQLTSQNPTGDSQ